MLTDSEKSFLKEYNNNNIICYISFTLEYWDTHVALLNLLCLELMYVESGPSQMD